MKKTIPVLFTIVLLLLGWQSVATCVGNPALVPDIPRLAAALGKWSVTAGFYRSVAVTLLRGLAGMLLSVATAAAVAYVFARRPAVYALFRPLLTVMRSVPVVSFILLALVFLQPESIPLLIAFLTMFPLLCENLTEGFRQLSPGTATWARTFRISRLNVWTQIRYPRIKPFLFSGLVSAAGFGWRAVIMGEVLAQCAAGIGSEMKRAQTFIDLPALLGWTLVAAGVGVLADRLLNRLEAVGIPVRYRKTNRRPGGTDGKHPVSERMSGGSPGVVVKDVCFAYRRPHENRSAEPGAGVPVLFRFSHTFEPGRIYGLEAPSGAGKSTLLYLIAGLLRPVSGTIAADRTCGVPMMFQEAELLPQLTVGENVGLPLATWYGKAEARLRIRAVLALTEMEAYAGRFPSELSYGQQQRVALARALACPAPLLLLDEPFKGLDRELAVRILLRIREKQRHSNQTVIFASHETDLLRQLADRVVRLP